MLADFRFALRQLAKAPTFTFIAWLTLSVGIGSATVVFSAINAFLFKPLPFIEVPEAQLLHASQTDQVRGNDDAGWSYPDYLAVRSRATSLAGLWVHSDLTVIIAGSEIPQRFRGTSITWDAFDQMGVRPLHGRNFVAADAVPNGETVALIAASVWRSRFGGAEDVVGRTVKLNGKSAVIVGIMPDGWRYPEYSDVWIPLRPDEEKTISRGYFTLSGRAKLKPGVTLADAQAELDAIMAALAQEFPLTNAGVGAKLRPIREEAVQSTANFTGLLFGAVGFVFLIACVNVANLLLARSITRSKEVAIRLALGAERSRVVRQLVTESIVLGFLGGVGGLIVGLWGNDALVAALPIEIPFWLRFDFDFRVFAFVFALSLVAALIFGLVPALKTSRPDLVHELKEGGRSVETSGPRAIRLRNALVVAEIALALVLLVGAGLMMRSFIALRNMNPGFDARHVLTFRTGMPPDMYATDKELPTRFFGALLPKLRALPGVESVALINWLPGRDGTGYTSGVVADNESHPHRNADARPVLWRVVSGSFFATARIPLKAGRVFDDAIDYKQSSRVVIIDEVFATRRFGSPQAAIGRHLTEFKTFNGHNFVGQGHTAEIIGVVGAIRQHLDSEDTAPTMYMSHQQWQESFLSVMIRTAGHPEALEPLARDAVISVHREIPIYDVFTHEELMLRAETIWPRRFFGYLFIVFGLVALFLACIGIYGVMAYNVTQRTQELGVRLALGAQPGEVIRLVVRHGLQLVGVGLSAGLVAAYFLANLLGSVLYGVSPHDPPTFALVPLLLAAVALVACWLSSRRATLIEPNAALRAA